MQPAIGSAFSGVQSAYGSMASGVVLTLRNLFADPSVKIAGRDGTLTYSGGETSGAGHTGTISPYDGSLVASGDPVMSYLGIPGVGRIPLVHSQGAATNLFLNSQAPATQTITVAAGPVTIYALGSGYTLTSAAGTAVGTGFGAVAMGVSQTVTITTGGTITLTVAGTPVAASVRVEAAALAGMHIPTAGAAVSRTADVFEWSDFGGMPAGSTGSVFSLHVLYLSDSARGFFGTAVSAGTNQRNIIVTTNSANQTQGAISATRFPSITRHSPLVSGVVEFADLFFSPDAQRFTLNADQVNNQGAATINEITSMRIGTNLFGGTAVVYRPGGLTEAEMSALQQLRQKTVAFVA